MTKKIKMGPAKSVERSTVRAFSGLDGLHVWNSKSGTFFCVKFGMTLFCAILYCITCGLFLWFFHEPGQEVASGFE
jgi:hypothetical protein